MKKWLVVAVASFMLAGTFVAISNTASACYWYRISCCGAVFEDYDGGAEDVEYHTLTVPQQSTAAGTTYTYNIKLEVAPGCGSTYSVKYAMIAATMPSGWTKMLVNAGGQNINYIQLPDLSGTTSLTVYLKLTPPASAQNEETASVTVRLWTNDTDVKNEHNTIDIFTSTKVTGGSVNHPPTLTSSSVNPTSGNTSTQFCYRVTYTDSDNDVPTVKKVVIDGTNNQTMTLVSGSYSTGAVFEYKTTLAAGTHNYYFYFEDGKGGAVRLPTSGTDSGPTVSDIQILDHITVSPASVIVVAGGTQVFTAQGYDSGNNPISGLTYTWVVTGGIGSVNPTTSAGTTTFTASTPGRGTVTATATYNGVTQTQSASVTVVPVLTAVLRVPNADTVWNANAHDILWEIAGGKPPYTINIFYSTDAGASFTLLATVSQSSPGSNLYSWSPTGINSQDAKIKLSIRDSHPSFQNVTSETFTIDTLAPTVNLDAPASGTVWNAGPHEIRYTVNENFHLTAQPLNLSYSIDDGASWTGLVTGETNTGSYNWSVPEGLNTMYARIKLSATDRAGNVGEGISAQFVIDTIVPEIIHTPVTTGLTESMMSIVANIRDNFVVSSARLYVKGIGETEFTEHAMIHTAGTAADGMWTANLPAQNISGMLEYYIWATDGANIQITHTYQAEILLPSEAGTVAGYVSDNGGKRLSDAIIRVYIGTNLVATTLTDSTGSYKVIGLRPNTYSLVANKTGYHDCQLNIGVSAGKTTNANFTLYLVALGDVGDIWGRVIDNSGMPLSAAKIEVVFNGKIIKSETTNEDGNYLILNLQAGNYELKASKEGYESSTKSVTVIIRNKVQADFTLQKSEQSPLDKTLGGSQIWMIIAGLLIILFLVLLTAFVLHRRKKWVASSGMPATRPPVAASAPKVKVCSHCGTSNPAWTVRCQTCNRHI